MVQIYIELQDDLPHPIVFELISAISLMNKVEEIQGILIGNQTEKIRLALEGYGISKIHYYMHDGEFLGDMYSWVFADVIKRTKPDKVLIGATHQGRYIAGALGVLCRSGVTADCTELYVDADAHMVQVRPAFGGNIMAEIVTMKTKPAIATVRFHVQPPMIQSQTKAVEWVVIDHDNNYESRVAVLEKIIGETSVDITKSKRLVVVGNGVKAKKDVEMIAEFTKAIDAEICGTKLAVQKGLIDSQYQIGMSGHCVQAELIILLGVSGAIQFQVGVQQCKKIVAINTDAQAEIFKIAHIPIVADLYEVLPSLLVMIQNKETET